MVCPCQYSFSFAVSSRESGGQLPNGHRTFATAFPFVVDAKSTYWNDLSLLPKQLSVMYVFFSCMCFLECVFHVCVFFCDLCQNCVLAVQCWQSFDRRCVGELCVGRVQCWQSSCVAEFSVGRVQCWQKFQCCLCVCRVPVLQISSVRRVIFWLMCCLQYYGVGNSNGFAKHCS